MQDIKLIRTQPDLVKQDLKKRKDEPKLALLNETIKLDEEWLSLKKEIDTLRSSRNKLSLQISEAKKKGQDAKKLLEEAAQVPKLITEKEARMSFLETTLHKNLSSLPNILHESVPYGVDDTQNQVVKLFGKKPTFTFPLQSHVDLLTELDIADLERAAKISGARFWFLKNEGALLDLALQRYAVDFMLKKGYQFLIPPYMIRREPYEGVAPLGDFEEVLYKVQEEDLHPIATSEHPLTAMYMNEVLDEKQLPIKMIGLSPCFRKEAGSSSKDTKGIFRGHQFTKVEQVIICKPEDSWKLHEELIKNAEEFFTSLGLHFHKVNICTGDIGIVAAKKYDLEVWMPVQEQFREVVSCSNCTDYQSRGLNMKYKTADGNKLVHTLNSTVVATSRAMVAILENCQTKNGTIKIPDILVPYMNGIKEIKRK
ncbi:serine--tRNA ligase [Candidatus Woesearchaeota archaeon]|nr:serine--tRNA ligase [Candidatus Woesearchaeota archaeon]